MALTVLWEGGHHDGTALPSGSYIGFYGSTFNSSIPLDAQNSLTTVTDKLSTVNSGLLPNVTYTTPGYGIWTNTAQGTSSGSIADASFGDMTLHLRITSGSAVRLSSVNLVAYEGIDINDAPSDMTVQGFEQGSTNWTTMAGLASPLALTPHIVSGSTTHDYYVALSASPTSQLASNTVSFAVVSNFY